MLFNPNLLLVGLLVLSLGATARNQTPPDMGPLVKVTEQELSGLWRFRPGEKIVLRLANEKGRISEYPAQVLGNIQYTRQSGVFSLKFTHLKQDFRLLMNKKWVNGQAFYRLHLLPEKGRVAYSMPPGSGKSFTLRKTDRKFLVSP